MRNNMKIRIFNGVVVAIVCFIQSLSASANNLTKEDVISIIMSGTNISQRRAKLVADQLEKTYGISEEGQLNISGVLIGSRINYGIFKDRKIWNFEASFVPKGSNQLITVPDLVEAEFFNGGLKINLISKDWAIIFLPTGLTVEDLEGFESSRGFSLAGLNLGMYALNLISPSAAVSSRLILPLWAFHVAPGLVLSDRGMITLVTGGVGLRLDSFSFPKFKFRLNRKYLDQNSDLWRFDPLL